jgi:hypothetical protein
LSHIFSPVTGHQEQTAFPKIDGLHHLRFYVGDARQAAHYCRTAFGFEPIALRGLETGARDQSSIVLQQGLVRLGIQPTSPIKNAVD